MDWVLCWRGFGVTQIALISQILLHCYACKGLTRVFLFALPCGQGAAEVESEIKLV